MSMISEKDIRVLTDSMAEVLGRLLSSVEFVQDYVQLRFDGPYLTAITLPVVTRGSQTLRSEDAGFRDALCAQIGQEVAKVDVTAKRLQLSFVNGSTVTISLLDDDYQGPEALNYITQDGRWVVV